MGRLSAALVQLAIVLALVSHAGRGAAQTTIDFDDLAAATCIYSAAPDLDTQYVALGVTFSANIEVFPKVVPASCRSPFATGPGPEVFFVFRERVEPTMSSLRRSTSGSEPRGASRRVGRSRRASSRRTARTVTS